MADFFPVPEARLPHRGTPGDVYYCNDTRKIFVCVLEGRLVNLQNLLSDIEVLGITLARGPQGEPGRDGRDGKDGVPGRDGTDGRNGKDGRDGNVCYIDGAEVEAACRKLRARLLRERAARRAVIQQQIADSESGDPPHLRQVMRMRLERLQREDLALAQKLDAEEK